MQREHSIQSAGLLVQQAMNDRGWSIRETADRAGISHSALHRMLRSMADPDLSTMACVGKALDIPLARLVEAQGYSLGLGLQAEHDDTVRMAAVIREVPELRTVVQSFSRLSAGERRAIEAVIKALDNKKSV